MGRDLSTPEKRAAYNAYVREWRHKNPEKQKAIERRWHKKQAALAELEEGMKPGKTDEVPKMQPTISIPGIGGTDEKHKAD